MQQPTLHPLQHTTIATCNHCNMQPLQHASIATRNHCSVHPLQRASIATCNHCNVQPLQHATIATCIHYNVRQFETVPRLDEAIAHKIQMRIQNALQLKGETDRFLNQFDIQLKQQSMLRHLQHAICNAADRLFHKFDMQLMPQACNSLRRITCNMQHASN